MLSSSAIVKCAAFRHVFAVFRSRKMGINGRFHPTNGEIKLIRWTVQWQHAELSRIGNMGCWVLGTGCFCSNSVLHFYSERRTKLVGGHIHLCCLLLFILVRAYYAAVQLDRGLRYWGSATSNVTRNFRKPPAPAKYRSTHQYNVPTQLKSWLILE